MKRYYANINVFRIADNIIHIANKFHSIQAFVSFPISLTRILTTRPICDDALCRNKLTTTFIDELTNYALKTLHAISYTRGIIYN